MGLRVHWFIQALGFATVSLAGIMQGGQLGGVVAGMAGTCAFLALNDWRLPKAEAAVRGLWWRLRWDPRLAKWRQSKE